MLSTWRLGGKHTQKKTTECGVVQTMARVPWRSRKIHKERGRGSCNEITLRHEFLHIRYIPTYIYEIYDTSKIYDTQKGIATEH